ncbi:hypothetical protein JA1_005254 [Spathaspora sp. JA1]|nr:hypothetical protein JA1_005254 [Spathaspora sp. JA1]
MNIFVIITFILQLLAEIIDLDEPTFNNTEISIITTNQSVTHNLLISIYTTNLKSIIYINNTNKTIIPTFLNISNSKLTQQHKFKYLEIENDPRHMRLSQPIPFSPCITNTKQSSAWVRRSSRIILESMGTVSAGGQIGVGSLFNQQFIQYILQFKPVFKIFKSRYIETIMGCSTNNPNYSARLFGYIPVIDNNIRIREIEYD